VAFYNYLHDQFCGKKWDFSEKVGKSVIKWDYRCIPPLCPMDIQEVLNWTDEQVFAKTGKHLESLQKSILEGIWQHQDYYEIAENNDKSYDHVKKEAWKLWKILSDVVGEDVKKSNVFSVLEQAEISENHADCLQIGNINICGEQQRSLFF